MKADLKGRDRWRWIFEAGWKGLCPRCGEGKMFNGWLKVTDRCDKCGLDYEFASPDDGPAFFAMCVVAFPLLFVVVGIELAFKLPWWGHMLVSLPIMVGPCIASLRPIKGWLVASQYINKAQQAGTSALWADLNERARAGKRGDAPKAADTVVVATETEPEKKDDGEA